MAESAIDIRIENQTRRRLAPAPLRRALRRILARLKIRAGHWSITFVTDRAMTELHARTMNLSTTTDVLTFDLRDADAPARGRQAQLDLDTVICADEAARRAKELAHPLAHELLLYAIHSLLHVRGYDDLTAADAARMHRREDALLIALGIGPVFAAGGLGGGARKPARHAATRVRKGARS
jgi:probable rRNA maturation factor